MTKGDVFKIDGYDLQATINYAEDAGQVLVMHNNSSHVLVATRDMYNVSGDAGATGEAVLAEWFPYSDDVPYQTAYREALRYAFPLAVMR